MFDFLRRSKPPATKDEAVPAEGKSFPLPRLMRRLFSGNPVWRDWSTSRATREGAQRSTWLYDAIELRRQAVASVPWVVETRNSDGEWERDPDHPLQQLLDRPNPDFTQREMMGRVVQWLDLGGNAYFTKVRAGRRGVPVEMWPVMPDSMQAIQGDAGSERLIAGYRFAEGGIPDMPAADVLHFAYPNPGSFFYGMGPVQAAAMSVDLDTEAASFQKVSLQNRGVPDGVFTLEGEEVTREEWEQAREQVTQQYQGASSFRAPWVVAQAKWQQMSLNAVEMDYINTRKEARVEILSALKTPPPMVGIYDDATLANIETARRIFWLDGIVPLLSELADALNAGLVPDFGRTSDLHVTFDTSNVAALRENVREKIDAAKVLWEMGVPFNQAAQRLELGMDDVPGGDVGWISSTKLPATQGASGASSGSDAAGGASDEGTDAGPAQPSGDQELTDDQMRAILEIIAQVSRGELPRVAAVELITLTFDIDEATAERLVGDPDAVTSGDDDESDEERAAGLSLLYKRLQRPRPEGS
jgi:HK97 family phage portal protein